MHITADPTRLSLVLHCKTRIGRKPEASTHPRTRRLTIRLELLPVETDSMLTTIDQHELRRQVRELLFGSKFETLEGAALAVAQYCLLQFPAIQVCAVSLARLEHTTFRDDAGWFEFEVTQCLRRTP